MPVADHRRTCDAMPQERRDAVVDVGARMHGDQLGHHDVPGQLWPVDHPVHREPSIVAAALPPGHPSGGRGLVGSAVPRSSQFTSKSRENP